MDSLENTLQFHITILGIAKQAGEKYTNAVYQFPSISKVKYLNVHKST